MYQIVLWIGIVDIIALVILISLLFYKFSNRLHLYLIFSCLSLLLNNVGYQLELMASSKEAYLVALKFSYLGRAWIGFSLLLFVSELCSVRMPRWLIVIMSVFNIIIYSSIFTIENNSLYYTYMDFQVKEGFPIIVHGRGVLYYAYTVSILLYVLLATVWIIRAYLRETNIIKKRQIRIVSVAILILVIFYIVEATHALPITNLFDITTIGYTIGSILFLVAALRYKLLDTATVAKQFALDELSSCCFVALNEDGKISYYNEPTLKLFPNIESNTSEVISLLDKHVHSKDPIEIDGRMYGASSEKLGSEGEDVGKIYLVNDETNQYQYMEDILEQMEIADNANKAKSSFLANMSHEIRSPINAIIGLDEMIIRESREQDVVGYASDIMTSSKTLLSIINDILDFSKVEEGKMEIIPIQYEIGEAISDLINMVSDRIVDKGLQFIVKVDERMPRLLMGDEIRIKQCILNILTNAVKYTERGKVTFEVMYDDISDDEIALKIRVSDTGIGMKQEDLDKLFSPFDRIEEKRNRKIEGTGLGMSITGKLLELMDSKLEVESVYGEGSTFFFSVKQGIVSSEPLGDFYTKNNQKKSEVGTYKEKFHAPDADVLVIDDTEINLAVFTSLLKETKIKIDTASSGKEGIELTKSKHYDAIFIDHMMPEMDGIQTLHYMKDNHLVDNTICVVLTANAVAGVREMYIGEGFDDYLSKPIYPDLLEQRLMEWLPDEKILSPDGDESPMDNPKDELSILEGIEGLDVKEGLDYSASLDNYLTVLRVFRDTAEGKAEEIRDSFNAEDWEGYTIKVHALKSSARVIGAKDLSELAKSLEEAGNNKDIVTINKNTYELLKQYEDMANSLQILDKSEDESLPPLDEAMRKDAYNTMIEVTNIMDYGMMESILQDLKKYKLEEEDSQRIDRINNMLLELDWDGISTELSSVK